MMSSGSACERSSLPQVTPAAGMELWNTSRSSKQQLNGIGDNYRTRMGRTYDLELTSTPTQPPTRTPTPVLTSARFCEADLDSYWESECTQYGYTKRLRISLGVGWSWRLGWRSTRVPGNMHDRNSHDKPAPMLNRRTSYCSSKYYDSTEQRKIHSPQRASTQSTNQAIDVRA